MRLVIRGSLTLLVVASLATGAPALAERRVSTRGSDAGDCIVASCRTVGRAILLAGDGETVVVARGTYVEAVTVASSRRVVVEGGYDEAFDPATRDPQAKNGTVLSGGKTQRFLRVRAGAGEVIDVTLDGVTVAKSVATSDEGNLSRPGGGVSADAENGGIVVLTARDVRFLKNAAATGGGLALAAADDGSFAGATLERCRFEQNAALDLGGGAVRAHSISGGSIELVVSETDFVANQADGDGGAVLASVSTGRGAHQHVYSRTKFVRNVADGNGGALAGFVFPGVLGLGLDNSMVLDNRAARGGGIDVSVLNNAATGVAAAELDLRNDTIVGNEAKSGEGGGVRFVTRLAGVPTVDASLLNTIIARNDGGDVLLDEQVGVVVARLRTNDVVDLVTNDADVAHEGTLAVDPKVAGKSGRLKKGSPMIDAGTCAGAPDTDIDGLPRPNGVTCDIGADEF